MGKVTPEIKMKMIEMREHGATYPMIQKEFDISKSTCIDYLKDVCPIDQDSAISIEWKIAEQEAPNILTQMGFSHIINLNEICNVSPHWDYYAENNFGKWLFDVTINGQKSLFVKQEKCVNGYNHAILLKTDKNWKLIELKSEIKMIISL